MCSEVFNIFPKYQHPEYHNFSYHLQSLFMLKHTTIYFLGKGKHVGNGCHI